MVLFIYECLSRMEKLEFLDDVQMLTLLLQHYAITWAYKDGGDVGLSQLGYVPRVSLGYYSSSNLVNCYELKSKLSIVCSRKHDVAIVLVKPCHNCPQYAAYQNNNIIKHCTYSFEYPSRN